MSAHDIASTLNAHPPASGRRAVPRGRAWAQFWAHSPPSAAVHQRSQWACLRTSRTVADIGERWSALLESVLGATPREFESRILPSSDQAIHQTGHTACLTLQSCVVSYIQTYHHKSVKLALCPSARHNVANHADRPGVILIRSSRGSCSRVRDDRIGLSASVIPVASGRSPPTARPISLLGAESTASWMEWKYPRAFRALVTASTSPTWPISRTDLPGWGIGGPGTGSMGEVRHGP